MSLPLPAYSMVEYKYIIKQGWAPGAHVIWQAGPNSLIATNHHVEIALKDRWEAEGSEACPTQHPLAADAEEAAGAAATAFAARVPPTALEAEEAPVALPAWAEDSVFYAIYPLGFFEQCPTENDHTGPAIPRLAGLRDYYQHFRDLGVNAVYFSPLFESDSHGYDTVSCCLFVCGREGGWVSQQPVEAAGLLQRVQALPQP